MALTVLTNDEVNLLLHSLTRDDIVYLQRALGDALHYYSTGDDDLPVATTTTCGAQYQPERIFMKRRDGSTTVFMPGASLDGVGIKVVTMTEGDKLGGLPVLDPAVESSTSSFSTLALSDSGSGPLSAGGSGSQSSLLPGQDPRASVASTISPTLTPTPTASSTSSQTRTPTTHSSTASKSFVASTSPCGSLTLLDGQGRTRALLNASEITAFRTALASTMLFNTRANVHDVVIFGAGKQAYWHARLALLLRGSDVHHLNVINRSFEGAKNMLSRLLGTEAGRMKYPVQVPSVPKREILTTGHGEYSRHLRNLVRGASVIFFTTPSTTPLFPHELLTNTEGRKKGRYLAAVGSYKPHMCEIPPEVIRQAVAPQHHDRGHIHYHRHASQGGAVVVDSVEACLKEAGELIQAGVGGREVVELGELIMLKRDAHKRKEERRAESTSDLSEMDGGIKWGIGRKKGESGKDHSPKDANEDDGLREWLVRGNVIYKSVGLALMVSCLASL
jgi:ornithine cyclodeaminase/alanine dehydrogenase-like protein (mu-crystallin family)